MKTVLIALFILLITPFTDAVADRCDKRFASLDPACNGEYEEDEQRFRDEQRRRWDEEDKRQRRRKWEDMKSLEDEVVEREVKDFWLDQAENRRDD